MKSLQIFLALIIGIILWSVVNVTFIFQQLSLIFLATTIIYLLTGLIVQLKYRSKQKRIISFLLLMPQSIFAFLIAYLNKNQIPLLSPGIFLVCIISFFAGFLLAILYKKRKYLFLIFLTLWLGLISYICLIVFPQNEYKESIIIENKPMVKFTLLSMKNDKLTSEQCKNKVVVMDFWTTSCSICYRLFPKIQELSDHYKNNKDIIIVAVNDGKTDSVSEFLKAKKIENYTFPFMYDISKTLNSFLQIKAYPLTCIIDKKGNIRYEHRGCGHDEAAVMVPNLIEQIDILLAE